MSFALGAPGEPVRMYCSRQAAADRNREEAEVIVETNREGPATVSADGLRLIFTGEPS